MIRVIVPICTECANEVIEIPPGTILNFALCIICQKYELCVYIDGGRIYIPRRYV